MLTRFARPREAVAFVALSITATALALIAVGGSLAQIGRTFPGFVVWDNMVVVALGRPSWTGLVAEVPYRARVVAVDEQAVATRNDLLTVIRATPAGTVHRYRFERPDGSDTAREVASMRFGGIDWLATMGVYFWNGLSLLVAGLAVFYLKPDAAQSRALLAFGLIWGLWLLLSIDLFTAGRLQWLYFFLEAMAPAAVLHFVLEFPALRWPLTASRAWLVPLYLAALAVGAAQTHWFAASYRDLLWLNNLVYLAVAVVGLFALGVIARDAVWGATAIARRRARVVSAGAIAAFLLPQLAILQFILLGEPMSFSWLVLTGFLFPLSIAYAVVRHDLFEADRFVKLSLGYAAITAILTLAYAAIVLAGDRVAAGFALTRSPFFPLLFALTAVATVAPLRARVQQAIDRLFYRTRVDYKATVARTTDRLSALLDRDAIVAQVVEVLATQVFVEGDVWQRDGTQLCHRGGTRAWLGIDRLSTDMPGFVALARLARVLSRDEILESTSLRSDRSALLALYDALDAGLVVPLLRSGEITGMLAVGRKATGGPLSADDVDVLRTLASAAAVALANATAVAELQATHEQLATSERLAAIGELAAAVAHGLRNPLAGIRLTAQVGRRQPTADATVREHFDEVVNEVDRIETQVRGILDFARPFEPQCQAVSVTALLEPVLATITPQARERRIDIDVAIAPDLPLLMADGVHLGQVFHELLANAQDAMPDGGRISIAAAPNGREHVRITVSDTGEGIPPELRDRVFTLFATTKSHGTGVGLAVVRKIIARHGGTIAVEENLPHGARFAMTLPTAG